MTELVVGIEVLLAIEILVDPEHEAMIRHDSAAVHPKSVSVEEEFRSSSPTRTQYQVLRLIDFSKVLTTLPATRRLSISSARVSDL